MQKNQPIWIALILVAVIAVLAIVFLSPKKQGQQTNDQPANGQNTTVTQDFTFVMPETWKYFENAQEDIQALTPDQRIAFGIVEDPTQAGIAYFNAVADDPNDESRTLLSVYKYDTSDYTFERIFKKSFAAEDITGISIPLNNPTQGMYDFHTLGYDQGELVILAQYIDDSPGPCTEPLMLGREDDDIAREMFSLDLSNPYAKGLEPYRVPDDAYAKAQQKTEECLENF